MAGNPLLMDLVFFAQDSRDRLVGCHENLSTRGQALDLAGGHFNFPSQAGRQGLPFQVGVDDQDGMLEMVSFAALDLEVFEMGRLEGRERIVEGAGGEVLDPGENSSFTDHYLGIPFDLSEVLFIATANYVDRIPPPLLDRMERVDFSGYTEQEKLEIAKRYLLPRQRSEAGLKDNELEVNDDGISVMTSQYTREAGVRQLERAFGKVARKVAREIAGGQVDRVVVTPGEVRELLGRPRVHPEKMRTEDAVGVTTGMFYTPMGGDIMFVEASVMSGEGGLVLTGQLGDVMKESGRAAWTFAKSRHKRYGISEEYLKGMDVHIHVPAGAVPKDGPSAGITMATALVSALSGRKVRRDIAMTGELTLTGRVLPIGGIKEKVLGAVRAGIHEIIIPAENEASLEDLPKDVEDTLTIHLVRELDDVIPIALEAPETEMPSASHLSSLERATSQVG